jgi:type IV pilus assembly protein PilM
MVMFGSKELIGLDIGSSAIKLAHVKAVGVEFRVRKFGVFPLPPDAIVDGAIMDHVSVIEGIKTALRELKVKEKEVATSLSGHSVIIKKVVLPTTTPEELEESIQWEVEQYIPFDIKDVRIDFQVIGPLKEDPSKMDVLPRDRRYRLHRGGKRLRAVPPGVRRAGSDGGQRGGLFHEYQHSSFGSAAVHA